MKPRRSGISQKKNAATPLPKPRHAAIKRNLSMVKRKRLDIPKQITDLHLAMLIDHALLKAMFDEERTEDLVSALRELQVRRQQERRLLSRHESQA
jgi:hypothetical protein